MDIAFVNRSRFLVACEDSIRQDRAELEAGRKVRIELGKGGYRGRVVVTIHPGDSASFGSDWMAADETQFPARIKAAATALLHCGCVGQFEVAHADGALHIRCVPDETGKTKKNDRGHTVYLVSCVGQKLGESSLAKDLYVSDWFKKARSYVEATGYPWFILSAEYGLVAPDQRIAPYEKTLNAMTAGERRQWASKVITQLDEAMPGLTHAVFLAGQRYREFLASHLESRKVAVAVPMEGLRIGEQLSWLSRRRGKRRLS
ncbi:MAG: DUF6884 domain-containing protein [Pirellulales bacterium]